MNMLPKNACMTFRRRGLGVGCEIVVSFVRFFANVFSGSMQASRSTTQRTLAKVGTVNLSHELRMFDPTPPIANGSFATSSTLNLRVTSQHPRTKLSMVVMVV